MTSSNCRRQIKGTEKSKSEDLERGCKAKFNSDEFLNGNLDWGRGGDLLNRVIQLLYDPFVLNWLPRNRVDVITDLLVFVVQYPVSR